MFGLGGQLIGRFSRFGFGVHADHIFRSTGTDKGPSIVLVHGSRQFRLHIGRRQTFRVVFVGFDNIT